ncbi:MAG: hypothetical protein Q9217_001066 [Psora testacea]
MAKKDKKSKTAEQKARAAAKQSKKAAQKDKKGKSKGAENSEEDDNVDLESVLEEYARKQAQFLKVTETPCDPPSARSAATIIGSPPNSKELFVFGGEYYNGSLASFFNDLFVYQIDKDEWKKNYIILFGGFQDTSNQTKYLQDLWIYDCQHFVWHNPVLPQATQKPDARSSFSLHPHDSGAVLYGGYSRVKANIAVGKQGKVVPQPSKSVIKPMIHEDTWFLRFIAPANDVLTAAPQVRWERRKKPANLPSPRRVGVTQVFHKGRGIMFGGVYDVEESEEGIDSEFFDQLYAWNIERNRFFQLAIRRTRAGPKKQLDDRNKRGRGKDDEAELLRNLAALEQRGSIADADAMDVGTSDVEEEVERLAKPMSTNMPHRRYNAQLAVQGDVLYIFGGTFEQGDCEYTFDEMHAIDLVKLDGVQEIYKREPENWQDEEVGSDSESNDEGESEEEDTDDDYPAGVPLPEAEASFKLDIATKVDQSMDDNDEEPLNSASDDSRPHPRPFESLRVFFTRTSMIWQELVLERLKQQNNIASQSFKDLRKTAFELAEKKWWDCREEIEAEEEQQGEAGIGEVVNLPDRTKAGGGAGRRR